MQQISAFGVSTKQVATHAVNVTKIEGTFVGDTASWIQLHDTQTAAANAAVPIQSKYVAVGSTTPQAFTFDFSLGELGTKNGLFIGVSSTEGTYTAASKNMDLMVELKQPESPNSISGSGSGPAVTVVGDLTTGRNSLQVLSEASGASQWRKLVRVTVPSYVSGDGTNCLMLFCHNSPTTGDRPMMRFFATPDGSELNSGDTFQADLGAAGVAFSELQSSGSVKKGITLAFSSTQDTLTPVSSAANAIRAEYI